MEVAEVVDAEIVETSGTIAESHGVTLFQSDDPQEIVTKATALAEVLAKVLRDQKLTTTINGREHVRVEGWTFCGTMLGVFPICVWSKVIGDGWEARVEARTLSGAIVGAAEAQCSRSEKTWAKRDEFALRSMAQTRATSKALRLPLGFVVALAGFDTTPAEEMDLGGDSGGSQQAVRGPERPPAAQEGEPPASGWLPDAPRGEDAWAKVAEMQQHIDPTLDWPALYKQVKATVKMSGREFTFRWINFVTAVSTGGGDFPPVDGGAVKERLAWAFDGLLVAELPYMPVSDAVLTADQVEAMNAAADADIGFPGSDDDLDLGPRAE